MSTAEAKRSLDFIRQIITDDLTSGRVSKVVTRFPPEPNGYLHIGHAKSICLNFGIAQEFGGVCHLRFDDTNPTKEEEQFVTSIKEMINWLGYDWGENLFFASDYFEQLYEWAVKLIHDGNAFVCDLNAEQMRQYRGTLTEPGRESPHRDRSVEENVNLFEQMRAGKFENGARTLRAKIDMASPNLNLRDPVLYRILHAAHHRTGSTWCIYPTYDFAHGQGDSIEGITHSLCTLEFEDHRPLYDWLIEQLGIHHPRQIEFARLNVSYMALSKRKLREQVTEGHVRGWDDPRMPTLAGLRRRGFTAASIRDFAQRVGLTKFNSLSDIALLEHSLRDDLNKTAPRYMAVLNPLRVVIDNYREGESELLDAVNNPEDESAGTRQVPFSRVIYIEREDFMEDPPRKFFRLAPGREVRLRWAYFITCTDVIKDESGEVVELRCTYDPATRGGDAPDGRRVKSTLHWVGAEHALRSVVRLYDRLFTAEKPGEGGVDFREQFNPNSLTIIDPAFVEPSLRDAKPGLHLQFERVGYFCVDPDSMNDKLVFNRVVPLRDTWAKIEQKGGGG